MPLAELDAVAPARIIDVRGGAVASAPVVGVLEDPTGRRRARMRRLGRATAIFFTGWLGALVLAGVGVIPRGVVPFAGLVTPQPLGPHSPSGGRPAVEPASESRRVDAARTNVKSGPVATDRRGASRGGPTGPQRDRRSTPAPGPRSTPGGPDSAGGGSRPTTPAATGAPATQAPAGTPPGHAAAPGQTGTTPGHTTAPGQTGTTPSHTTAPGQTGTTPDRTTAPGQTGTTPDQTTAPGQTGSAPGSSVAAMRTAELSLPDSGAAGWEHAPARANGLS